MRPPPPAAGRLLDPAFDPGRVPQDVPERVVRHTTQRGADLSAPPALRAHPAAVDLFWLPLGAGDGTHCVRTNGRIFEALSAGWQHRDRCDLYHAALQVHLAGQRFAIEMTPAWGVPAADRGVVCEGPVGLPWLGRARYFRYEVRCWRDGVIPDLAEAVESPRRVSTDEPTARRVLSLAPHFPATTWGRDELRAGEMWNSNALVAWLLAASGHAMETILPPAGGRAPGWLAGLVVASRQAGVPARSPAESGRADARAVGPLPEGRRPDS